jgi:hypothetical protein
METSRADARAALLDTIEQLEKVIPTANFQEQISLHAITPHLHSFQTTIGREVSVISLFIILFFLPILDSYGSPVYTVCTTGRW